MNNKRGTIKTFVLIGALLIIFAGLLSGCLTKKPTIIEDEQKIEYGDDLRNQTFTIHHEGEDIEGNFTDLDPDVDTLELGETEHKIEINKEQFLIRILVEDTEMPVFNGIEDSITLTGETIDIEKELKKRITAEDPVDGDLEVSFEIHEAESDHTYDVEAKAKDFNGNETIENFEVILEIKVVKEETENEDIPFETIHEDDASLNIGMTKVSVEGETGRKEVTYEVTYINDEEVSREKVNEKIIEKSKDKVVLNGINDTSNSESQTSTDSGSNSNSNTSNNSNTTSTSNTSKTTDSNNKQDSLKEESNSSIQGPSGSNLVEGDDTSGYLFSYNDSSLPGGGNINGVVYTPEWNQLTIDGVDKDGNMFVYDYTYKEFAFEMPNLSNGAINKLNSVGSKFMSNVK